MYDNTEHVVPGMALTYPTWQHVDQNWDNPKRIERFKLSTSINWIISDSYVDYQDALASMNKMRAEINNKQTSDLIEYAWLLEHSNVYTCGLSARPNDLLFNKQDWRLTNNYDVNFTEVSVIKTCRGGKVTFHGPGQRICYLILNLKKRGLNVNDYIFMLEEVVLQTLQSFGVTAFRKSGQIGAWVRINGNEKKIASIGVSIKQNTTTHGFAINNSIDLRYFKGIIPCGMQNCELTSLQELGVRCGNDFLDLMIQTAFYSVFK